MSTHMIYQIPIFLLLMFYTLNISTWLCFFQSSINTPPFRWLYVSVNRIPYTQLLRIESREIAQFLFHLSNISFFKKDFIYLWKTQRERQRHRQREKQAPQGEPDVGLHPETPGSRPEPKADTYHQVPLFYNLKK